MTNGLKLVDTRRKGALLLEETLQALTLAVAQANMLYGDMTADFVYSNLWDKPTMKFKTISDTSTDIEKGARELLRNNPYLARNVLMMALDKSWKITSSDGLLAYEYAFKFLGDADFEPEHEMKSLFNGDLVFKAVWKTKLISSGTPEEQAATDMACGSSHDEKTCVTFLYAEVSGVDVPLPSPFNFSRRNFVYPAVLTDLAAERDKVAARVADYKALKASPNGPSTPDLVRTVVSTYTN